MHIGETARRYAPLRLGVDFCYPHHRGRQREAIHDKTGQFQQSAERLRRTLDATLDAIAEEMRRQHNLAAARNEIDAHIRRQAGRA